MFCILYSPKQNIVKFQAQKQIGARDPKDSAKFQPLGNN
jgi:hypothetical protein